MTNRTVKDLKNPYTTDGKLRLFSTTEEDINTRLGKLIGKKFVEYRNL